MYIHVYVSTHVYVPTHVYIYILGRGWTSGRSWMIVDTEGWTQVRGGGGVGG